METEEVFNGVPDRQWRYNLLELWLLSLLASVVNALPASYSKWKQLQTYATLWWETFVKLTVLFMSDEANVLCLQYRTDGIIHPKPLCRLTFRHDKSPPFKNKIPSVIDLRVTGNWPRVREWEGTLTTERKALHGLTSHQFQLGKMKKRAGCLTCQPIINNTAHQPITVPSWT